MNKKLFYIIVLLLFTTLAAKAKTVIGGIVRDKEQQKSISDAVVTICDDAGEILAYGISRNDGTFSVEINSSLLKLTVYTRLLGYETDKRVIENCSQRFMIDLTFGKIQLKELTVKSRPIWNREDTLVYSVDAFKGLGDKTIGDILKKLPGVEVSESGGIKYQGESINKFYIEGLNLLENRYGIATNNVSADAVQNIEIIENHEPLKVLKDYSLSDKAAINLKLKKDRLGRPVGSTTLGSGISDERLWLAETFALNTGKKSQYIVMYKTNNVGKDIASELKSQSFSINDLYDVSNYTEKTLFNTQSFGHPPIEKKTYLFNNTHVATINKLWKTTENSQFRMNIQYLYDVQRETVKRNSAYFLPDSTLRIYESNKLSRKSNVIDVILTFTDNSPDYYLNNTLKWSGEWNKVTSLESTNTFNVHQYFKLPAQFLKNDLKYVKRFGERVWDFTSFTVYASQPQCLKVDVDTIDTYRQQIVDLTGFYTRNATYYGFGAGSSNVKLKAVLEASFNKYSSALLHPVFCEKSNSNLATDYLNLEITPTYTYRNDRLTVNADLALRQHALWVNDRIIKTNQLYSFSLADPSLLISYNASSMLTARVSYRSAHTFGDFMDLTDAYFMSSYRNFGRYSSLLKQSKRQSFSGGFRYRNPLSTFFLNSSIVYAPEKSNTIPSQQFIGNEFVLGSFPYSTRSNMLMWQAYTGKYFAGIHTSLSLSVSYTSSQGERLQQEVLYPYRSSGWNLYPKVDVKLSDDCSLSYQSKFNNRIAEITRTNDVLYASIWQVAQQFSGFYLIGKQCQINAKAEYSYNEIGKNNTVKMLFADVGITYKQRLMDFELSWNNIFNQKTYRYSTFNDLDRFDYVYSLRPAMLLLTVSFKY